MTKTYNNKLYQDLKYKELFLTNVDGLDIPFSKSWRRVGVNLSGGADSALLAAIICKIIYDNNLDCKVDAISYIRCWNSRPWQQHISMNVFNELKSLYPNIITDRHVTFIPPEIEYANIGATIATKAHDQLLGGDAIIISSFNTFIAYDKKLNAVFNGITSNPPGVEVPGRQLNIDSCTIDELLIYKKTIDSFLLRPFKYIQKDWILAQYRNLNLMGLYQKTRSCEGDINSTPLFKTLFKSFKDYKIGMTVPICGECDWCKERAWAEKQLLG